MVLSNPLFAAGHLAAPAYVSYWSALHHDGFTEQVPLTTFVATTRIAPRNGLGMQVQERDYSQHLLLWLLYSRSQALVYKGGTALRMIYGGNRYSEDPDFSGPSDVVVLQSFWQQIITRLRDFGIPAERRRELVSDVGYNFDVSFQGPLYEVWLMLNQGVQLDDVLVERKLALYEMGWDRHAWAVALNRAGTDWERDLRHLLPQFVPYEIVREGILARLD
jgi:hypothetical protein